MRTSTTTTKKKWPQLLARLYCLLLLSIQKLSRPANSFTPPPPIITRLSTTRHPSSHLCQYKVTFRKRHKTITATTLQMGKGDGKKKRKKKSAAATSSASTSQPSSSDQQLTSKSSAAGPPLRVSTNINIPVKHQIRWAKLNQQYIKKSSQTSFRAPKRATRTAFRKSLDVDEQAELLHNKRKRNSDVDWDVILQHGNGTSSVGPLMLVDGYNVIYQWSRLKKQMMNGNTQRARELLVRDLEELHNIKGWRIECVFDGFGRKVGGALSDTSPTAAAAVDVSDRQVTREDTGRGVRIVYSGVGASADSYIESRCIDAKSVTAGKLSISGGSLIVVSNDAMIRMVASGAGALCMSSDRLVDELKAVKKITDYRVEVAMAIANGGYVRPEGMRKNRISTPMMQGARGTGSNAVGITEQDGRQVVNTFRGGQFIIEDKRKRKKKITSSSGTTKDDNTDNKGKNSSTGGSEVKRKATMNDLLQGTQTMPSWAVVPKDATKFTTDRR